MRIITSETANVSRQSLQKAAAYGRLKRLFRGVYVDAKEYAESNIAEQYCTRAQAFLCVHPKLTAWGITAAALEGTPVLQGTPLHFAGKKSAARSRMKGCVFHQPLAAVPEVANPIAQTLFECAVSSPLSSTLLAANYLLRKCAEVSISTLYADRCINKHTTEALIRLPLSNASSKVCIPSQSNYLRLNGYSPGFLAEYTALRKTEIASADAELLWFDYAQLCAAYRAKRTFHKALRAGLYFSDQTESPAEALLVARCAELGFATPYLQVSIVNPADGHFLGRVDGLWPSAAALKGLRYRDTQHGRLLFSNQYGDNDSVVVEFDGQLKYDEDYVTVLEKERQRQNAIGNLGYRFVRIGWKELMQPMRLRSVLSAANVPLK